MVKKSNTISCAKRMSRVVLSPYNPNWSEQFKSEAFKLEELLGKNCNGIHHIGSTAIPGIYAKFEYGNPEITRHLAFRDHMNKHPDTVQGYSWIKRGLAEQFPNDIEAYVSGKESFIRMIDYRTGVARKDQLEGRDDISLMQYDPKWRKLAIAEIQAIIKTVGLPYEKIEHLGSTAVENLKAKPMKLLSNGSNH